MIPGITAGRPIGAIGPVTFNPSDKSGFVALSNGNLSATRTSGGNNALVRATLSRSTGKRYFEILCNTGTGASNFTIYGLATASLSLGAYVGSSSESWGLEQTGLTFHNASGTVYAPTFTTGSVVGIAVDFGAQKIWFAVNGTWAASGNPATGENPAYSNVSGELFPAVSLYNSSPQHSCTARFHPSDFQYSAPAGFISWGA